ncbi:MAG: DUF4838 domain-containing protein [Armatimonadota bacterium]
MRYLMLAVVALAISSPGCAAPVTIVQDGQPLATIVTEPEPPDQVSRAVAELVSCVQEASGATLTISADAPADAPAIHVGQTAFVHSLDLDFGELDGDGYVIQVPADDTVVIVGPTPFGTEFGVYGFLKRYLGVRWLLPGESGRDVPAARTITIPDEPVRDEPAFMSRLFSGGRGAPNDWAVKNGMHGTISFHHNLLNLYDPEVFAEEHPEFYPIVNGERYIPGPDDHRWQPCFTAPGIVEAGIRRIIEYFEQNPDAISYSLGINDSNVHCQCPQCQALDVGRKNFLGLDHLSDRYFTWANAVVEGVLKVYPDKWFGCLAYNNIVEPPDKVEVHPRIIPYMTYDRMKWIDPEIEAQGHALTEAWAAKSPTLGWYDYIYGTPYCLPRYYPHKMREYLAWGYEHGVSALYAEAYPNFGEGPKLYAYLALNWDPYLDLDALLDDWFARCCGPDGMAPLKAYYEFWEDFWTRRILDSPWFTVQGQYLRFSTADYLAMVTPEEMAQCRAWLEQAIAAAQTDKQRARGELLLRAFEYYEASALAFPRADESAAAPTTEAEALARLDTEFEPVVMAQKRLRLALEFEDDPVLVMPLPPTRYGPLAGSGWGTDRMWQLYEWVQQSPAVRDRLQEIADTSPYELVRDNASLLLQVAAGTTEPLNANPSFEEGDAWATGWSSWVASTGREFRTTEIAHSGQASVCCEGMARGGPNQILTLEPGKYAITGFVYVPGGQESTGTVELSIIPRDAANNNLPGAISSMIRPAAGRWQAVAAAGEIPPTIGGKRVTHVLIVPIVNGWQEGERVYIDDVSFVRVD